MLPFFLQVEAVIWRDAQIQQVLPPLGGSVGVVNAINDNGQGGENRGLVVASAPTSTL